MKILIEFTPEDFKAKKGLSLDELLNGKAGAKAPTKKKPVKEEEEEEEEEETEDEEEDEEEETEDEEEESEVDDDLIKTKIASLSKAGKQASIAKVFAKYKCKTVSGLKQKDYEAFYADLNKIKK